MGGGSRLGSQQRWATLCRELSFRPIISATITGGTTWDYDSEEFQWVKDRRLGSETNGGRLPTRRNYAGNLLQIRHPKAQTRRS